MPKLKTRKAARKRYKAISNGKFMRKKAFRGHLLEKKNAKRKRRLGSAIRVSNGDNKAIKKMLVC